MASTTEPNDIPFLRRAARHVFERCQGASLSIERICVVLPTRRAVFFFKEELARQSTVPFLSPDVLAIEDFVLERSGLRLLDNVGLLFALYDTFKAIDPQVQFERFAAWGGILLQDMDRIDQYLVNAKGLFSWVAAAKDLERWSPSELWQSNTPSQAPGPVAEQYFKLFDNLTTVYQHFRTDLISKGMAYRGMAYRQVAERLYETLLEPTPQPYEYYFFAGFNALSTSEEAIITYLIDKKKAETLWDTDAYYMERNRYTEAGQLLRKYKANPRFGATNQWLWQTDGLLKGEKDIRIVAVTNASMQVKVAGAIRQQWQASEATKGSTAIVLGDENLLLPMLYSLDENVGEFNVTMGLSLRNSMLFTLVDAIFDLQRNMVEFRNKAGDTLRIPKFSHHHVLKVLNHPFVRRYELIHFVGNSAEPNPVRAAVRTIKQQSRVFLTEKEIKELGGQHVLFEVLFSRWDNDPQKAIAYFERLMELLRAVYRANRDAIETEYLYLFSTLLTRLKGILSQRAEVVSLRSFRGFLYDLIRQTKIPFSGEPVAPLQIMGMLETRTLDFERVLILSMNEGVLPQGKKQNSLIPFDAAVEFGLPTHTDQDAVMSYHFFRLLQRAKEVVLVHAQTSGDTGAPSEPSRFLLQIEHELAQLNPQVKLQHLKAEFATAAADLAESATLEIWKNEEILTFLRQKLAERGLYPSHLNQYVRCTLQYYFSQVAKVDEEEEIEEKLGTDEFGNWIHGTLETIDKRHASQHTPLSEEQLREVLGQIPELLREEFAKIKPVQLLEQGQNYILYQIAQKILEDLFLCQIKENILPLEILDVETKVELTQEFEVHGQATPVKLAGRIDRLDRVHGHTLRVIDYKTGLVKAKDLGIASEKLSPEERRQVIEEKLLYDDDWDKIRQLWLYKYLILKKMYSKSGLQVRDQILNPADNAVQAGIYSFRNLKEGFISQNLFFEAGESQADFIRESETKIQEFLEKLLDPAVPFHKTPDLKTCQYCSYKRICGR